MKTITKRFLPLLLIAMLAGSSLVSCTNKDPNNNNTNETTTTVNTNSTSTTDDSTQLIYKSEITDKNYNGHEFKVLVNDQQNATWLDVDFTATEENGDVLNDAVYKRNRNVEELLNIKVVPVPSGNLQSDINKSVLANDKAFDTAFINPRTAAYLSQEGKLVDLNTVSSLNLSNPWWDQNAVKELSINNKLYMMAGDIGIMPKKSIGVILFNKKMANDYDMDSPYKLVKDKKWTMNKFFEMSNLVSEDLDNNGKFDQNDKYGLVYYCDIINLGLIGGGVNFTTKNQNDIPELTFYNEKTSDVFEKFTKLLYDDHLSYSWSKNGVPNEDTIAMFQQNQSLFMFNELHSIANMRSMETDFGILPIPLYDDKQERYYHTINPHVAPMLTIPISNDELERTGIILEALAAESKNILTPAYYDVTLKGKGVRDDESSETLDIVFSTLKYDAGYLYNWGEIGGFTLGMVDRYDTNLASQYEKIGIKAQAEMDKAISKYKELS